MTRTRSLFLYFCFFKRVKMFYKITNIWIPTLALCCWKGLLCQVCYNHHHVANAPCNCPCLVPLFNVKCMGRLDQWTANVMCNQLINSLIKWCECTWSEFMTVFCVLYHIIVSSQSRLGVMQYYLRWLSIPRKFHGLSHQTSDQKIY